jgi:phosphoglycolate phosphatase
MAPPTVVFDLDGTLVDTAPDLIATLNTILGQEGLPPVAFAAARNMVGGGARHMLERGLAADGRTAAPPDLERLCGQFIAHYADHIADRSLPFPDVEAALDTLADRGYRLAARMAVTAPARRVRAHPPVRRHLRGRYLRSVEA